MHSVGTQRVYVHWDIILKAANNVTDSSYLYENTGKSASQNFQVTESCASKKSAEITGFSIEVTLFCLTLF